MHSPIEPGSPTLSTPTSESDIEEVSITGAGSSSTIISTIQSSSSKRRLNPGMASNRDPKSRRRDHTFKTHSGGDEKGARGGNWEKEKKEKDELLDMHLVEFFRKEIGDPFVELSFD
ncbi:hypothetical protein GYMLUDRAFT_72917 [Collybiopsis luxurians FD-317 M1]|uniref:Uncharacterized protein n=1 Tax=Collybiopsis luxurians FD-317 M1 TaxID=944289 RepID=A0A0D0CGS5_9AGAR|nr:hypothetical protein GYMLUDRAFT_72917 [Collybiopsis luxurians FD-317 M1]